MLPAEALTFLRGLAKNNNRDWFHARKETYETKCKAPMLGLIEAVNAELMEFAPEHVTDPKKALYRIHRDTRFSADKTPYKTNVAAIFPHRSLGKHVSAGFYFHVSTDEVAIGAGMYMPGPDELRAVRTLLLDRHEEFRKLAKLSEKAMGPLEGEAVARMPKGFDPESPAADLIRRKQWLYWKVLDPEVAATNKLRGEIVKCFKASAPLVNLLNSALQRKPVLD